MVPDMGWQMLETRVAIDAYDLVGPKQTVVVYYYTLAYVRTLLLDMDHIALARIAVGRVLR